MAMRCLLRAVAAKRHAAPAPRPAPGMVGEEERAGRALAGLHVGEVLGSDEPRQGLSNGKQQGVRIAPAALRLEQEWPLPLWRGDDALKHLVALEETIKGRQLGKRIGGERLTPVPMHEGPEPFPKAACLVGDLVEL